MLKEEMHRGEESKKGMEKKRVQLKRVEDMIHAQRLCLPFTLKAHSA